MSVQSLERNVSRERVTALGAAVLMAALLSPWTAHGQCPVIEADPNPGDALFDGLDAAPHTGRGILYENMTTTSAIIGFSPNDYWSINKKTVTGAGAGAVTNGIKDRTAFMRDTRLRLNGYVVPPWRDNAAVRAMGGWTNHFQAQDYNAAGATFPVYAMAQGRVIFKGYMASPGNVVIIEYTLPNGETFQSVYHHLRDGLENDIRMARATSSYCATRWCASFFSAACPAGAAGDDCRNWKAYDDLAETHFSTWQANPNDAGIIAQWGTEDQALLVNVGDVVSPGQLIGYAGDTGVHSGSIHLHWFTARRTTHVVNNVESQQWTRFDPTGLYTNNINCYRDAYPSGARLGTGDVRQHKSIMAPYGSLFTKVGFTAHAFGVQYFNEMGWFQSNITTDNQSSSVLNLTGEFRQGFPLMPVQTFRTRAQFLSDNTIQSGVNRVPGQISVDAMSGSPRYTTLYKAKPSGYVVFEKLTSNQVAQQDAVANKAMVELAPYVENNAVFFAAAFQTSNAVTLYGTSMTKADIDQTIAALAPSGLHIIRAHRYDVPNVGERYAAVWSGAQTVATHHFEFNGANAENELRDVTLFVQFFGGTVLHTSANRGQYSLIYALNLF